MPLSESEKREIAARLQEAIINLVSAREEIAGLEDTLWADRYIRDAATCIDKLADYLGVTVANIGAASD